MNNFGRYEKHIYFSNVVDKKWKQNIMRTLLEEETKLKTFYGCVICLQTHGILLTKDYRQKHSKQSTQNYFHGQVSLSAGAGLCTWRTFFECKYIFSFYRTHKNLKLLFYECVWLALTFTLLVMVTIPNSFGSLWRIHWRAFSNY